MTGIRDAAIYVGESRDALVAFNEVHQNVVGIQIENSTAADVRDNQVYDNTAGIVVVVLPLKLHKKGVRTRVHRNRVSGNNRPNAGDPRSFVGRLPSGAGILVAAADDTVVEQNRIEDNHSYGIAVVRLSKRTALRDFMLEPRTDRARIADNDLHQNGLQAHPSVVERWGRGADLIWDGSGRGNCFTPHGQATRAGTALPPCGEGGIAQPTSRVGPSRRARRLRNRRRRRSRRTTSSASGACATSPSTCRCGRARPCAG
jgi:hypothetical protein